MSYTQNTTKTERHIISRLLAHANANAWYVSVYDGEEWVARNVSPHAAKKYMATTCENVLRFQCAKTGERIGVVALLYGNDEDIISDSSDNDAINKACEYAVA